MAGITQDRGRTPTLGQGARQIWLHAEVVDEHDRQVLLHVPRYQMACRPQIICKDEAATVIVCAWLVRMHLNPGNTRTISSEVMREYFVVS